MGRCCLNKNFLEQIMSALSRKNRLLLINGYIRSQQIEKDIPSDLIFLMLDCYPIINFTFGWHDEKIFEVSDNGTMIKPINDKKCEGYLIYANLLQNEGIGLISGIWAWSIKSITTAYYIEHSKELKDDKSLSSICYRSIGVSTQKKEIDICQNATPFTAEIYWIEDGHYSFFDGISIWNFEQVMTMIVDCNEWKVTYYLDGKQVQKDKIEPNKHYYPALLCCA